MLREGHWRAVAVVTRDDAHALRLTLLSAHVRPDLPLWVTMFDHTVSRELEHVAPKVHVLSPSEIVAGDLAEGCLALAGGEIVGRRGHGVRLVDDALRLLVVAGVGLFGALVIEMVITMIAFHHGLVDAFYFSTRSVATVAGPPGAANGPGLVQARLRRQHGAGRRLRRDLHRGAGPPAQPPPARPPSSAPAPPRPATTSSSSASARSASASPRR